LANQNEICGAEQSTKQTDKNIEAESAGRGKKLFVEPEISVPVDVLEATTFFQVVDSGGSK
jgi:hypothetical protein